MPITFGREPAQMDHARDSVTRSIDALRRIFRAVRLSARHAERKLGLSGAQLFVLQQLGERRAGSVNDLAQRTHTHQSSVSVVVRRLVTRGLVTRTRAPDDARRLQIRLSAAGRALLRQSRPAAQSLLIEAIAGLPSTHRRSLASTLERLVAEMGLAGSPALMLSAESEGRDSPDGRSPRASTGRARRRSGAASPRHATL
jgi:DNA-binding MarR family transcriptional regulator